MTSEPSDPDALRARILAAKPQWILSKRPIPPFRFHRKRKTRWMPRGRRPASWSLQEIVIQESIDWRDRANLFEPRDQGDCNSCTSYSVAALMGDLSRIRGIPLQQALSPSFIHVCLAKARCADPVPPGVATKAAMATGLPYVLPGEPQATSASCATARGVVRIAARQALGEMDMALAALQRGPILAAMDLYPDFWSYYGDGIYRHTTGDWMSSHCMVIVGYDRPNRYWIIKNSEGIGWGDGGYAKVAFGECRIFTPAGNGGMQIDVTAA